MVEPRPALVPLTLGGEDVLFRELSGVATEVDATTGKTTFREAALMTHRGLSGPAILQVSSYWKPGEAVTLDFLPHAAPDWLVEEKRARPSATLRTVLRDHLPDRLADVLAERLGVEEAHMKELQEFNEIWDKKVADFEHHAANLQNTLAARHQQEHNG